jgi:hypothetical protein
MSCARNAGQRPKRRSRLGDDSFQMKVIARTTVHSEQTSNDGVKHGRPSLTDAASAASAVYAGSINVIAKPMSNRAAATRPQRQVVNR